MTSRYGILGSHEHGEALMRRTMSVAAGAAVVVLAGGITAAASQLTGSEPVLEVEVVEPTAEPDPEPEPAVVPELPPSVDWMAPEPDPVYSRTVVVEPDEDVAVEDETSPSAAPRSEPSTVDAPVSGDPAPSPSPEPEPEREQEPDVTDQPEPEGEDRSEDHDNTGVGGEPEPGGQQDDPRP